MLYRKGIEVEFRDWKPSINNTDDLEEVANTFREKIITTYEKFSKIRKKHRKTGKEWFDQSFRMKGKNCMPKINK